MIEDIKKQLQDVIDYFSFHNKNLTKEQDCKIEQLKDILEKVNAINVWFEVARNEVKAAIEDVYNDELYNGYQEELDKLSEEDINTIAWRVEDNDVWGDVYDMARNEIYDEIGVED